MPDARDAPRLAAVPLGSYVLVIDALLSTGTMPLLPRALLDETAHAATAILVSPRLPASPAEWLAFMAGATLLDLDHLPRALDAAASRHAKGRPPGHSILAVLITVCLLRLLYPGGREMRRGLALGMWLHLLRDMATGGVPLLWPLHRCQVRLPVSVYAALLLTPRSGSGDTEA